MCADQMCDEHHLSQERTQEAATKTGAAVTSGGTEGLLPLCVSGQKTRTMFKEKGKAKHPARIQEAQEEAGPSGLGRLLLLLGTCPRALPNFSALMFNPRKTEEPDHKAIHACRGMEVAASVVSQKHVGTARREREGRPQPLPGKQPTLLPSRWAGPGPPQRDIAQEPPAEASKHAARGFQRERETTGGNSIQVKFNTNTGTHFRSSRSPNGQQVGTTQTPISR